MIESLNLRQQVCEHLNSFPFNFFFILVWKMGAAQSI